MTLFWGGQPVETIIERPFLFSALYIFQQDCRWSGPGNIIYDLDIDIDFEFQNITSTHS